MDNSSNKYNIWNKWDKLKTVMLGDCYSPDFFCDIKNKKIKSALQKISEETKEDLEYFESVLKDFGCEVLARCSTISVTTTRLPISNRK